MIGWLQGKMNQAEQPGCAVRFVVLAVAISVPNSQKHGEVSEVDLTGAGKPWPETLHKPSGQVR